MSMTGYEPRCGDVGFTRDPGSALTPWTRWATQARGEAETLATHQFIVRDDVFLVQALRDGVSRRGCAAQIADWQAAGVQLAVLRPPPVLMGPTTQARVMSRCDEMCGLSAAGGMAWRYSDAQLALCLLDGLLEKVIMESLRRLVFARTGGHVVLWRRLGRIIRTAVICSETAAWPLLGSGIIPDWMRWATPDDAWDWCAAQRRWQVVAMTPGWWGPRMVRYERNRVTR
jgi:hypothetical protein